MLRITYLAPEPWASRAKLEIAVEVAAYHVCRNLAPHLLGAVQAASNICSPLRLYGISLPAKCWCTPRSSSGGWQRAGCVPQILRLLFIVLNIDIRVFLRMTQVRTAAFIAVFAANSVLQYTQF